MNKFYVIIVAILITLGAGLFFLPERTNIYEVKPEVLLQEFNNQKRFWSTDMIAEKLIDKDPSLLLIDVRSFDEYMEYSLPNAMNIPLGSILDSAWMDYFDQDHYDIVLFSNGDIYADQAWFLLKRRAYQHLYIMKGGLNCWAETILQPVPPRDTDPIEAFELYDFRKGASMFFGAGTQEINQEVKQEIIAVKPRKKKTVVEGGC
ncbi:MAG: rhodanese-like domain-containing protein [Bacteroidota bacterium]|nr:rhodanese-like domain-containing protein [Bacteroidota bacterium]